MIGHRGAAGAAPENTLASLEKAADLGARWVEFDVKLTRDGVPVLFHDDTLRRTTGQRGRVIDTDFDELRTLDAGGGARVPTLDEALACLECLGLGANVEIKPCPGREVETAWVVTERLATDWPDRLPAPLVSSFAFASLETARARSPDLALGFLAGRLPRDWAGSVELLGCASVHLDQKRLDAHTVAAVKDAGLKLLVYTVNDPTRARDLLGSGVDAVFTDWPDRVLAALASA